MSYPPIPVFRWTGAEKKALNMPKRLPDDDPEQMTLDASYGAATALAEALRRLGHPCEEPEDDETNWAFDFTMGPRSVFIFLNWTAIEYPPHNYIAVQWHVRRTFWEWVLRRRVPQDLEAAARHALEAAITSVPDIEGLQWLSEQEFHAAYCLGKPLPGRNAGAP